MCGKEADSSLHVLLAHSAVWTHLEKEKQKAYIKLSAFILYLLQCFKTIFFFQYMVLFQVHLVGQGIKEKEDTLEPKEKKVHLNNIVMLLLHLSTHRD